MGTESGNTTVRGRPTEDERGTALGDTSRLPPLGESSRSEDAMIDGPEVVTAYTEEILNRTVYRKEPLDR